MAVQYEDSYLDLVEKMQNGLSDYILLLSMYLSLRVRGGAVG